MTTLDRNYLPPMIPPAAALVGLDRCLYQCYPTLADVGFDATPGFKLYAGSATSNTPVNPGYVGTAPDGSLRMYYSGQGNVQLMTQNAVKSATLDKNVGALPYSIPARGLHHEARLRMSTNDPDCFNAYFSMPQQHNTIQSDSAPGFPPKYEQWHEFDYYESGHGTDQSGAYRGAYLQWSGIYNGALTLAAAPAKGATSIKLAAAWAGETGNWTLQLSSGERHSIKLIAGNAGPYTIDAVINTTNTTAAVIGYTRLISPHVVDATPFDATQWHVYAGTYDPWNQAFYISVDNVIKATLFTSNANSGNKFRDSLSHYQIFLNQSHGGGIASYMDIDYFSAWST